MKIIMKSILLLFYFLLLASIISAKEETLLYGFDFDYYKTHEMKIDEVKLEEKDPVLASTLSFLIPGGGFLYLNDYGMAAGFFLSESLLSLSAAIAAVRSEPGSDATGFAFAVGFETRYLLSLIEMIWVAVESDNITDRYYRQLLYPNSPYRVKRVLKKYDKNPWGAFFIAWLTIPGMGNYYAENTGRGNLLLGTDIFGLSLMAFSGQISEAAGSWDLQHVLLITGLSFICLAKLVDMISAPWYVCIKNDLYGAMMRNDIDLSLEPSFVGNKPGLCLSCRF